MRAFGGLLAAARPRLSGRADRMASSAMPARPCCRGGALWRRRARRQPSSRASHQELEAATKDPGVRERLKATFVQIDFAGPQEFAQRSQGEIALYGEIIRAANINGHNVSVNLNVQR